MDATTTTTAEKLIEIKTGELFTVTTPEGLITETGMRELQTYLYDIGAGELPTDFEPVWIGKRGALPKRVQTHVYKAHKVKLTTEQISVIGNIAKRNTSTAQTYIMDFTKSIDWSAGDFGDGGSCYWGGNSGAKLMLEEHGYAVRLYRKRDSEAGEGRENLRGYSRAWIAPIDDNRIFVFNGYGETSLVIARLLAYRFSCQYQKVALTNNGTDGGLLYINGGGNYIVGAWEKIKDVTKYDLGWDDINDQPEIVCHVCDNELDRDDYNCAYNRYGESVPCCDDCSIYCERCNNSFTEDCARRLDDETYCRQCRDEVLTARRDELEELKEKQSQLEGDRDDLEDEKQEIEDKISELGSELEDIAEKIENLEGSLS